MRKTTTRKSLNTRNFIFEISFKLFLMIATMCLSFALKFIILLKYSIYKLSNVVESFQRRTNISTLINAIFRFMLIFASARNKKQTHILYVVD